MPMMYEKKVKKITGTATSKPVAKKPVAPKPNANMAKMNKTAPKTAPVKPKAKLKPKSKMGMM